eukprot:620848-Prorocentrum_minimum.AAC.4
MAPPWVCLPERGPDGGGARPPHEQTQLPKEVPRPVHAHHRRADGGRDARLRLALLDHVEHVPHAALQ